MTIVDSLKEIAGAARFAGLDLVGAQADALAARTAFDRVHLVVVGEFNRGKTTLVNALIGQPLLPMDIVPTTAAIWVIDKGEELRAVRVGRSGEEVPLIATPEALSRLSADGDLASADTKFVKVQVPRLAVGDDVIVIDTPGVNDINQSRAEITYGFLGKADAALFLMDASSPLTRTETDFLKGQVLDADLDRIVFVLNKTSRLDADEVEEAVAAAKARLREALGREVPVVAADAARVLLGLSAANEAAAAPWGWPELRGALDSMLAAARDEGAREATARRRGRSLASVVAGSLQAQSARMKMSTTEMEASRLQFEADVKALDGKLTRLVAYAETQGRERLKLMISQSLRTRTDDFVQGQQSVLDRMRGDFEPYVQKQLPRELQMLMKHWFEVRVPVIDRFLREFSAEVAADYHTHFGEVLVDPPKLALGDGSPGAVSLREIAVADANEYVQYALPAAGALAVGFLLTGPFVIVGAACGAVAAKVMRDREVTATRETLSALLPDLVDGAITPTLTELERRVDDWFSQFATALQNQYARDVARRRSEFERARSGKPEQIASRIAEAETWLSRITSLTTE